MIEKKPDHYEQELQAMRDIASVIEPLPKQSRVRVVQWAMGVANEDAGNSPQPGQRMGFQPTTGNQ